MMKQQETDLTSCHKQVDQIYETTVLREWITIIAELVVPESIETHVMSPMIVLQFCPERISRFSEGREIQTEPAEPTELR